jgi:hypothetical protein
MLLRISSFCGFVRSVPLGMVAGLVFFGAVAGGAATLLLEMPQGSPNQYHGAGKFVGEHGLESLVSAKFTVPRPIHLRIDSISAWINGSGVAWVGISPVGWNNPIPEFYHSIPLEQVDGVAARWQGVDSLNWTLVSGEYNLFLDAPDIPFGFGFNGPSLTPAFSVYDLLDYSMDPPFEMLPFGIQVYGTVLRPLSGTPEPGIFGLMGCMVLLAVAVRRRFSRVAG